MEPNVCCRYEAHVEVTLAQRAAARARLWRAIERVRRARRIEYVGSWARTMDPYCRANRLDYLLYAVPQAPDVIPAVAFRIRVG